MKTVLMTAYAVNPYKGSEDGMGWNFIIQTAKSNKVIAITRKNNGPWIEKYIAENKHLAGTVKNIAFLYFDTPAWTRWWKKGPFLSMIYYYFWQLFLAFWIKSQKLDFDIAHNLNFHNDWTPSFLWLLGKPLVWGPVGHHPLIPKSHLSKVYGARAYLRDRLLWIMKWMFWTFDPFLYITKIKAEKILCMNSSVAQKLNLPAEKCEIVPSVAVEMPSFSEIPAAKGQKQFTVMMAARMVPLKDFDMAIKAFSHFVNKLPKKDQSAVKLQLIGDGPCRERIEKLIKDLDMAQLTELYPWIERAELLQMYQNTDIFIFPSHEGAGMVVAEAMGHGVPVLCYDNYGPGELTPKASKLKLHYKTYEENIIEFAQKLYKLYKNEDMLKTESELCRRHTFKYHLWSVRGDQLENIYNQIDIGYERDLCRSFA